MGVYRVVVCAHFSASHQLRMYDGQLEPMHGHRWRVEALFAGPELDEIDVLIDFIQARQHLDDVLASFHNHHLNDLPCFGKCNPSAENVARQIFESLQDVLPVPGLLKRVTVTEAPDCLASYGEE